MVRYLFKSEKARIAAGALKRWELMGVDTQPTHETLALTGTLA